MLAYGPQYSKDDAFKARARLHQSRFRAVELGVANFRDYGSRLPTAEALEGKNFYGEWPGLLDAVAARFPLGDKKLYWDLLGSDNVPFNMFVPLRGWAGATRLFAGWVGSAVASVVRVAIEWAPAPKGAYLDDATSFDVYVEYLDDTDSTCGIGIELKYTEGEYRWGTRERPRMWDQDSAYLRVNATADLYLPGALERLRTKKLKQIWRNQLLGASMQQQPRPLRRFTSVLIYPSGNLHFRQASDAHAKLLRPERRDSFCAVTYEQFIGQVRALRPEADRLAWVDWLERRYIP